MKIKFVKLLILLVLTTTISFGKSSLAETSDTLKYPYFQLKTDTLEAVFSIPQYKELKVTAMSLTNCYRYANVLADKIDTLNSRVDTLQKEKKVLLDNIRYLEEITVVKDNTITALTKTVDLVQKDNRNLIGNYINLNTEYINTKASKNKWQTISISTFATIAAAVTIYFLK